MSRLSKYFTAWRDSGTGKFVTAIFAKLNPLTTTGTRKPRKPKD